MSALRQAVYQKLDPDEKSDWMSRSLDIVLIVLIAVNVGAVVLESVESIRARHAILFWVIEVVSVAVFSLEYAARVWASVEDDRFKYEKRPRLSYMLSPMAVIDLLAIAPFFLGVFISMDLRFLRVLRLLRILKLTRYSAAMSTLLEVLREESSVFFAGFFILGVLMVLAASGAYLAEHAVQPEHFGSIPESMWWAIVTLTTLGYGDVVPITPLGKLFGGLVAVVGIGMAALPAGILASGMADRMHRNREELSEKFRVALEDGVIDSDEDQELDALRRQLGLSKRVADNVRKDVMHARKAAEMHRCPHCGKKLMDV